VRLEKLSVESLRLLHQPGSEGEEDLSEEEVEEEEKQQEQVEEADRYFIPWTCTDISCKYRYRYIALQLNSRIHIRIQTWNWTITKNYRYQTRSLKIPVLTFKLQGEKVRFNSYLCFKQPLNFFLNL
jgi:hypothetical protein